MCIGMIRKYQSLLLQVKERIANQAEAAVITTTIDADLTVWRRFNWINIAGPSGCSSSAAGLSEAVSTERKQKMAVESDEDEFGFSLFD